MRNIIMKSLKNTIHSIGIQDTQSLFMSNNNTNQSLKAIKNLLKSIKLIRLRNKPKINRIRKMRDSSPFMINKLTIDMRVILMNNTLCTPMKLAYTTM